MFDRYAERLYDIMDRHHRAVRVLLLVLLLFGIGGLFLVRYESSMDDIVPQDEVVQRTMRFFRNSDVTGRVIVSFGLTDGTKGLGDLLPEVDRVAAALDRTLFPAVQTGLSQAAVSDDVDAMLRGLPGMVSEDDLRLIDQRSGRQQVAERLRGMYLQMLKPEGMFTSSLVRSDPLGMQGLVLQRVSALASATGFDVTLTDGHFVSRDGRHALLIAKSTVPVVDAEGARRMLGSLQAVLAGVPPFISADVISGHSHTVSNEKLIKDDVNTIGWYATIGFFLLYVVIIQDLRSVLIFLMPYIAMVFAILLTAGLVGSVSFWVIGLGSAVAGITIDYGSHVYFSLSGREDRARIAKRLIRPISFGAFSTIAVFAAFFLSGIRGYSHLAVFSIFCILFSTFLSLYVMPHFMPKGRVGVSGFVQRASAVLERGTWSSSTMVWLWLAVTAVLGAYAFRIEFEQDIRRVDGTERSILAAEERFHETWGGKQLPAVLVVTAPEYQQALVLNEQAYREAVMAVGTDDFTSIAPLLPSEQTRRANVERWTSFWSSERRHRLRALFAEEGKRYGFSAQAFEPFFRSLDAGKSDAPRPLTDLAERFVQKVDGGWQVLSYFPDRRDLLDAVGAVSERLPGTYIVSGTLLSSRISAATSRELALLSIVASVLVLVVTYVAFWNVRETVIAMVPPITSLIWLLGIMRLAGMQINVANMIAGVVVIGLASDYGIFMSFWNKTDEQASTVFSITLCTLTTVIGAGALVFARHPALWTVGVTVVIGVLTGFLTSILVVPKLGELWGEPVGIKTS